MPLRARYLASQIQRDLAARGEPLAAFDGRGQTFTTGC